VIHKDTEITKMNSAENDDGMFLINITFNISINSYLYDTSLHYWSGTQMAHGSVLLRGFLMNNLGPCKKIYVQLNILIR